MARIMIVDDEPDVLRMLAAMLKTTGHDIVPVLGGVTAKARLESESEPFDVLVTDLHMNPVNGLQLLRLVHERHPETVVVMLTAYGKPETAIEAMSLGAFDYLSKPCRMDKLLGVVHAALESRHMMLCAS